MVIADSSTLIHLAAIDRLELLRDFYGTIVVPEAVWRESVLQGTGRPGVDARWVAGTFGLPKTGVIGILIRARTEERIPSLRTELDNLRSRAGFWIEQKLYRKALSAVGEAPASQD